MIRDLLTTFGLGWWYLGCVTALVGCAVVYAVEVYREHRGRP